MLVSSHFVERLCEVQFLDAVANVLLDFLLTDLLKFSFIKIDVNLNLISVGFVSDSILLKSELFNDLKRKIFLTRFKKNDKNS